MRLRSRFALALALSCATSSALALPTCEFVRANGASHVCDLNLEVDLLRGAPLQSCDAYFQESACSVDGTVPDAFGGDGDAPAPDDERCDFSAMHRDPGEPWQAASLLRALPNDGGSSFELMLDAAPLRLDPARPWLKAVVARLQVAEYSLRIAPLLDLALRPAGDGVELVALDPRAIGAAAVVARVPLQHELLHLLLRPAADDPGKVVELCAASGGQPACQATLLRFPRPPSYGEVQLRLGLLAVDAGLPDCGGVRFKVLPQPAGETR